MTDGNPCLEVDKQTNKQTNNNLCKYIAGASKQEIEQQDISDADKTTKLRQEVLCITHKNC
jgi:hypothetical protein